MSEDIYRKIGFDASQAIAELGSLTDALRKSRNALKSFDSSGSSTTGVAALGSGLSKTRTNMVQFADGSRQAVRSLDDLVAGAQRSVGLLPPLANNVTKTTTAVNQANQGFTQFAKTLRTILITRAIIGSLGLLTNALRESAQAAEEFQLKIEQIQTIGEGLNSTSEQLSNRVLTLSRSLGTDSVDTAAGLYQVLSNQVVEAGESFAFLEQAQKLSLVAIGSTQEAVDTLSSIMNAYSLDASEAARASDVLFEAVNVGRFKLEDIADIIGRVTPLANEMGISFEEVLAAMAAMTQQGVRADTAITQLRAILTKSLKPTEALANLYKRWGVEDGPAAIQAFGGLQGLLVAIQKETGGSTAETAKLFNEVRGLAGVLALGTDDGKSFGEALTALQNSAGRLDTAFERLQDTPVRQLQIATEDWNASLIEAGTALIPIRTFFKELTTVLLQNATLGIQGLSDQIRGTRYVELAGISAGFQREMDKIAASRKAFTAFDDEQYKEQTAVALNAARQVNLEWSRVLGNITTQATASTNAFSGYANGIVTTYEQVLQPLNDFVDKINDKIKDSQNQLLSDQQTLTDLEFQQELAQTPDIGKQKKQYERALQEFYDARSRFNSQAVNEETREEYRAALNRVTQLFKEAESTGGFFTRKVKEGIIDVAKEQVRASQQLLNQQQALRGPAENLQDRLGPQFEQAKLLTKELLDQAKQYQDARIKGDDAASKQAADNITRLKGQLQNLKLSAEDLKILEGVSGEAGDLGRRLNAELQSGLDKATYNWTSAIESLKTQLAADTIEFNARANVQAIGGDLSADGVRDAARTLGVEFDSATGQGEIFSDTLKAAQDQLKGVASQYADIDQATQRVVIGNQAVSQALRIAAESAKDLQVGLSVGVNIPDQATLDAVRGKFAELGFAIKRAQEQAKQGQFIDPAELTVLQQRIDAAVELGQLPQAIGDAFRQSLQSLTSVNTELGKIKDTQDQIQADRPKTEAALDITQQFDPINSQLINLREQLNASLKPLDDTPAKVGNLTNALNQTTQPAQNTANAVLTIGNNAQSSIGQVNALTGAMNQLAAAAASAAQASASVQAPSATTARFGKYFAHGGLGLKPLGSDTIPAMIQRGEFVMNKRSAGKYFSQLNAMNQDSKPVYRREGGSVTNVGDVNVTVQGGDTSRQTVRAIASELNRELKRGTIRLGSIRKA